MPGFTTEEFLERVRRLKEHLTAQGIDLAILNQNSDLYYYTGSVQPLYLLVPAAGEPLVVARKAITRIKEEIPHLDCEVFFGTKDLAGILERHGLAKAARIGLTLDTAAYATVTRLQRLFGLAEIADLSWDIRVLRAAKSESEIAIQAKAGEIMAGVHEVVTAGFRPGMSELELSAILENCFRLNGHSSFIRSRREGVEMSGFGVLSAGVNSLAGTKFEGICAGKGLSAAVPYGASRDPIQKGVPVILDYAFNLDGYHVDQTRMFSWCPPSDEVLKAYDAMLEIEDAVIGRLKPGTPWEDAYSTAIGLAGDMGYGDVFMGIGTERVKFVGHGVGLELDEPPYLAPGMTDPLAVGMVIAVEPKVALPGVGVIGIEDTVVITESGAERITPCSNEFMVGGT